MYSLVPLKGDDACLAKITELAGLYFRPSEIAVIIGAENIDEFTRTVNFDRENPISRAYWCGKLMTEYELRCKTRQYAVGGSPEAQQQMERYLALQRQEEQG